MSAPVSGVITAIVPCNDLDRSEAFYNRLGFSRPDEDKGKWDDEYRILHNEEGGSVNLTTAVPGWVVNGRNPFGLYLYTQKVDELAYRFFGEVIEKHGPSDKEWGMYEFALSDPDGVLVRVGWPTRLRQK